ncbi:MAG: hypothetical protein FWG93_00200 [Oscillospiraceae bacterium]|nr:hypothetical protein [Oscillospiraceae bacterium]
MRISAAMPHPIYAPPETEGRFAPAQAGESRLDAMPDNLKPEHLRAGRAKPDPLPEPPSRGQNHEEVPKWLSDDEGAIYDGTKPCTCEKCAKRLYQDGSADAGVTFKAPTRVDPSLSHRVIASHEREHIKRESYQASQAGGKVVSAQVRLFQRSCKECGVIYASGGMAIVKLRPNVSMYEMMGYDVDTKA